MKITIDKNTEKYTVEIPDDTNLMEFLQKIYLLTLLSGYVLSKSDILESAKDYGEILQILAEEGQL
ncbi:MAG: hypothetical protein EOM19_05395 [Candidatus Moranbacteria bacterium]|nr:hypothetical protein [Candidatus Moranbacteria bacterium]